MPLVGLEPGSPAWHARAISITPLSLRPDALMTFDSKIRSKGDLRIINLLTFPKGLSLSKGPDGVGAIVAVADVIVTVADIGVIVVEDIDVDVVVATVDKSCGKKSSSRKIDDDGCKKKQFREKAIPSNQPFAFCPSLEKYFLHVSGSSNGYDRSSQKKRLPSIDHL